MMWPSTSQGKWLSFYITFASGAGFALFGYDQGVFGALLDNESFIKTFNNPDPTLQGQITAIYDLGCFAGALLTMWRGNRFGSRKTILAGCTILILGAILQTTSYHTAQMIIGRFVAGVGNGMNTTSIPVWQSETAPAKWRGRVMVLQLALNQFGNVSSQWINYGMTFISSNSVSWRFPLAFQCFWAILAMAFVPFLPDSPRWLIMKERNEEALEVIQRLGGNSQTEDENRAVHEEIRASVQHEMSMGKINIRSLLKSDSLQTTRRIILGAGTQLMQQWSGINALFYYLPVVFASLGVGRNLSLILSSCNAMNMTISTVLGALWIEGVGRKKLMVWGAVGQSICFCFISIGLSLGGSKWEAVAVAFVFGYSTVFALTWIAVPWMYPAEVNTQRMRIAGAGVATATNWINNYVVVLVTPVGIRNLNWRYYLIYAVLNAAFAIICKVFYVETARLSLEQIDSIFDRSAPIESIEGTGGVTDNEKATSEALPSVMHVPKRDAKHNSD
ncbi:unnamed protein product [Clonostachys byssicola]|uniref:Major facilitator superfamily (MFS) profile domain-containing protein n=1 Tax=Clonostachys byssicola TaxID=160290 RepID=A0A9N9UJM1_9HYPO|nr:unnamed protein product [Clonostachys byssicola]